MTPRILSVFGTRPEAIKMAPLVKLLEEDKELDARICVTGQHREMLDQVMSLFQITPNYDLDIMSPGQALGDVTSRIILRLDPILEDFRPSFILVHGDTATTFAAALAGFYKKIPVGHIEAGLRTGDLSSPWPEEANRKLTAAIATLHFAPTSFAAKNLKRENIPSEQIEITGNTVIDALFSVQKKIMSDSELRVSLDACYPNIDPNKNLLLVTGHRRENFGEGFERICKSLKEIAQMHPTLQIVYPVHLNPNVKEPVERWLTKSENILLIEPLEYAQFVNLMMKATLILTDSGGIQEEAPSFGKKVLVMRNKTERQEAVEAGTIKLVGTNVASIVSAVDKELKQQGADDQMRARNPYGDGSASDRIVRRLKNYLAEK